MESDRSNHRRHQTTHSIPLQDLSRPPEPANVHLEEPNHRRTLSDRGRRFFNRSGTGRHSALHHGSYKPLVDPTAAAKSGRPSLSWTPTIRESDGTDHDIDEPEIGELSPLADRGGFQVAMGFAGLTVDDNQAHREAFANTSLQASGRLRTWLEHNDSDYSLPDVDSEETQNDSPPIGSDTDPLTNTRHLQPMGATVPSTPPGQIHDRLAPSSAPFGMSASASPDSRLGDDLAAAEAGTRTTGRGRSRSGSAMLSLSPSAAESPLHRAGTIVRKMSQRVVNLSNEPEIIEADIRRSHSQRATEMNTTHAASDASDYAHDGGRSPVGKFTAEATESQILPDLDWKLHGNPLRGKSLGLFSAQNKVRTRLCDLLVHPLTEPFILVLILIQTVLLAVESAPSVFNDPRSNSWGTTRIDYALLALFVIYSIEILMRVIVSGFVVNPVEYSTINRQIGFRKALIAKSRTLFALHRHASSLNVHGPQEQSHPSIIRTLTGNPAQMRTSNDMRQKQRIRLAHRAFLRHSFNRVDFLAVLSYWISFGLAVAGIEAQDHIYVFRMMSCLRILRLLSLTSGTTIILRSLKKAAPLLLNVALLIGFFWLLFAIIGAQIFKGSLRRTCVWTDPANATNTFASNITGNFQFCGGSLDPAGIVMPWLYADGSNSSVRKGYLCPPNSQCISAGNPYNGTVSFDNVLQSLELVFVIMTSNTLTDLMYYLTDSDYLIAALFFALGTVVMTLWLVNLLIAVITSSFQIIREESKNSAFAVEELKEPFHQDRSPQTRKNALRNVYVRTFWPWIVVIVYGLVCQCLRSAYMSDTRAHFISLSETGVTFVLLFEIVVRFLSDWRTFFMRKDNWVDLSLAVITSVMQIPAIHGSGQPYAWLTLFQILRIYRVVLAIPLTRNLVMLLLRNLSGLLNLILFVFLLTFLTAIFASQLFRGELPQLDSNNNTIHVTFATIYNSFLGMYQVLSSENWTLLVYNVTSYEVSYNTAWIGAIFFILWFILSYFVVLNMFIAVIQESFDVSEDEKRLQQVKAFLQKKEVGGSSNGTLALSSVFKLRQFTGRRQDPLDYGPAMMEMLLKEAVVKDFLDENIDVDTLPPEPRESQPQLGRGECSTVVNTGLLGTLRQKLFSLVKNREPNPFYSRLKFSRAYEDLDARTMAKEVVSAAEHRKRAQRDYLIRHPTYNVSLFIFTPRNSVRRLCQKVVGPGRGSERFEGAAPNPLIWYTFSAFLYVTIVAMVLLACIITPLYQKQYFATHSYSVRNWFVFTDLAFATIFSIEAVARVIADGLFWTPNAYYRSSWGLIDGLVLVTLWVNVASSLYNQGAVSRAVGAFQALRALRLLNISDSARETFHSVIVRGGWKVISAAFVSLSLLIPFAIYGLNLFNGQMQRCNDTNSPISNLTDCVDEWMSSPYGWSVLAPRQAKNPYYDFDNFGDSLFILFQIVSLEGWVDVMWSAESITGFFSQPQPYASQGNALFFVVFNLLATVFVLTLFISVFMRNYTEQTGVAFLTTDQRSWLELRKLLRQVSPSKRPPSNIKRESWQQWCYRRAVRKTGRWQRFMTCVLVFHLILLCIEIYPDPFWWELTRDYIFLGLTVFYIANIAIRIVGLTWTRFRKSSWDIYSLFAVFGTFITTILYLANIQQKVYAQVHQLFLVSIALLLIPRNNQLDQLFKTAAASLAAIANLMATWFVLFLVFAIALNQTFGLTRFNSQESDNLNFRTVPKALILLYRMSLGEGWNQIMEDFATVTPPLCTTGETFLDGDCGSPAWARALFISWNILSMYIFFNMFISLIYESFSYVYQRSSGLSAISRKEIRRFKQAWAECDPDGTGYISKTAFPKILRELSGVFEMRIYDGDFTVTRIKEDCSVSGRVSELPIEDRRTANDIDLVKLNARLALLPVEEIRQRRTRLNVFYEEVMMSADTDRGIAFTSLLMILAHYKVINDNKSLRLEEFLRRRARLQRVEEAVRRTIVGSFFDTLYWSRRFRRATEAKRSARMTTVPQLQVPEIFVEDEDEDEEPTKINLAGSNQTVARPSLSLQIPTFDITEAPHTSGSDARAPTSSTNHLRNRSDSIQLSPGGWPSTRNSLSPKLSPSPRISGDDFVGDFRLGAPGLGRGEESSNSAGRSRATSNVSVQSVQNVLEVLDNSAWGESIRKSFTLKRNGSQ